MKFDVSKNTMFIAFTIVYMIVMLSFVSHIDRKENCEGIKLDMPTQSQNYFIDQHDVMEIIETHVGPVLGQPLYKVSVRAIEESLETHSSIKNAEVYVGADNIVHTRIEQRTPLIRVIDKQGRSYYIDDQSFVMAISKKFTARVPIANGNIVLEWDSLKNTYLSEGDLKKPQVKFLYHLYTFANFVARDEFWSKQIQQVYINEKQEIELIPRVGAQIILLGNFDKYQAKLAKLKSLYTQAFNKVGWNQYRTINLKYDKQVICTKR